MTRNLAKLVSLSISIVLLASFGFSQDRDTIKTAAGSQYLISAKAGGVNYISGRVSIDRKNATSGYLVKGDSVEVGEKVITDRGSRTEILLNPGSYARIDENSSFEFITTDLDDLQLKLNRGSAIFEVYAGNGFYVTVLTPTSRFYLIKSGVYRVDVLPNGASRIEVRKGKAQVGTLDAKRLGKGKSALVSGQSASFSKFKRSDRDGFESWSRNRAKGLAKANARLKSRNVRRSVYGSSVFGNRSTFYGSGVWAYDGFSGSYCYLPFGNRRSPYGFGLRRNISYDELAQRSFYNHRIYAGSGNGNTGGSRNDSPIANPNPENNGSTPVPRRGRPRNPSSLDDDGLPVDQRKRSRGSNPRTTPRTAPRRSQPRTTPRTAPKRSQPRSAPRSVSPPRPQPRRASPPPRRSAPPRSRPAPRSKVSPKDTDQ